MRVWLGLLLTGIIATPAMAQVPARGLSLKGGQPVDIRIRGVREHGLRLKFTPSGWSFSVDVPSDGSMCIAELRDVSPLPVNQLLNWTERVKTEGERAQITLDPSKYFATHAYRVSVRCGIKELTRGYVWLAPSGQRAKTRIELTEAEAAQDDKALDSDEIGSVPKGSL